MRFQSSQHFLQLDWVISCQGQVVSIEHVSYPEPLSASNSTHKAKLIIHTLIKREKRRGDKGQPCFTPFIGTVERSVCEV